jgi:hypothetical protein
MNDRGPPQAFLWQGCNKLHKCRSGLPSAIRMLYVSVHIYSVYGRQDMVFSSHRRPTSVYRIDPHSAIVHIWDRTFVLTNHVPTNYVVADESSLGGHQWRTSASSASNTTRVLHGHSGNPLSCTISWSILPSGARRGHGRRHHRATARGRPTSSRSPRRTRYRNGREEMTPPARSYFPALPHPATPNLAMPCAATFPNRTTARLSDPSCIARDL